MDAGSLRMGLGAGDCIPSGRDKRDLIVPDWLRGRRQEATATIGRYGLVVWDDDQGLSPFVFGSGPDPDPQHRTDARDNYVAVNTHG